MQEGLDTASMCFPLNVLLSHFPEVHDITSYSYYLPTRSHIKEQSLYLPYWAKVSKDKQIGLR